MTSALGGAPAFFDSPEDMEKMAEKYFCRCDEKGKPPTTAGLAHSLGFTDRQSLYDYKKRDGFSCVVKRMLLRIESFHEALLTEPNPNGYKAPTGSIFWLKNHNWSDAQQLQHSGPDGGPIQSDNRIEIVHVKPDAS